MNIGNIFLKLEKNNLSKIMQEEQFQVLGLNIILGRSLILVKVVLEKKENKLTIYIYN